MNLQQIVAERQQAVGDEDIIIVVKTHLWSMLHDSCGLIQLSYLRWHAEPTSLTAQVNWNDLLDIEPSFGRGPGMPDEVTVYIQEEENVAQWPAILLMLAAHHRSGGVYVEPPIEEPRPGKDMPGWTWSGKRKLRRSRRRGGL